MVITNENKVFRAILALIFIIIIYIMDIDRLLQIILSMAVPLVVYFIFYKINNPSKKLYFSTVIIVIFLFTALNSILNQNYSLSYILPSFAGVIMALYYISNWKDYVSKWEINTLVKEGKLEETLPYLDNILKSDPQNFPALYNKAAAFNRMGKYAESIELADKILKKDPENDYAMNIKSNSLIKLEKYDESMEIIDKLLQMNSKNAMALLNKAQALLKQGNYQDSIRYYENALENMSAKGKLKFKGRFIRTIIPPSQLAGTWFEKGKAHQALQQYNKALECYNIALDIYPDSKKIINSKDEVINLIGK